MKWVCLMANMMVPGVGSMIAKRYGAGAIQALGSLIAFGMVGYCISEFYTELKNYADSLDGDPDEMNAAMKTLGERILGPPIIVGGIGVIILKVTWIWAQFTTAAVFKKEKEAEAQVSARPAVSS
ncbi:MAG: hypothetical protein VYD34_00685 [Verrucomicrobiota bacterium]|nr:hypothetical protein [Verrucomicrobiota bacterium]MEE2714504.1 hypothetical protein [Verrucomicrobiota bacterium]